MIECCHASNLKKSGSIEVGVASISTNCERQPEGLEIKLSELKEKEIRLRKWEQDLKLKEKTINEHKKDRAKIKLYAKKLEARNLELEQIIKTLATRVDNIEHTAREEIEPAPNNHKKTNLQI